jgi:hypothetical protein
VDALIWREKVFNVENQGRPGEDVDCVRVRWAGVVRKLGGFERQEVFVELRAREAADLRWGGREELGDGVGEEEKDGDESEEVGEHFFTTLRSRPIVS